MAEKKTFSDFQANLKPPVKNIKVDFTTKDGRRIKYNYASLADLIESVKKPLGDAGMSFTQTMGLHNPINTTSSIFGLTTTLYRDSVIITSSFVPLPDPISMKPQDFASFLTYFRRYSLSCILGIESEDDDDGQVAQAQKEPDKRLAPTFSDDEPLPNFAMTGLIDQIKQMASKKKITAAALKEAGLRLTRKNSSTEMNDDELNTVLNWVKTK